MMAKRATTVYAPAPMNENFVGLSPRFINVPAIVENKMEISNCRLLMFENERWREVTYPRQESSLSCEINLGLYSH
jgi:hypothetical protein